ncbi:AAA family ATPase [Novispirillum itersonii]|uniref:AAA family ATPase n=1 Tax=Novispirillum itersonii TaxID=189 RepID=UPI00035D4980|nr:DUF3696 domain-containing protein [Novispirillum itersonii]
MIERILLGNFKCFETLALPVAPLTLLTGFNAGGKSTVTQVLLLLAQTLRSAPESCRIALNGPLAQLGTAAEVMRGDSRTLMLGAQAGNSRVRWILEAEDRRTATALDISSVSVEDETGTREIKLPTLSPWRGGISKDAMGLVDTILKTIFISAVRTGLSPTFPSPEDVEPVHADVGPCGQFASWWLAQYLDEEVEEARRHRGEAGTTLRRQVGAWASELFPGAQVNAGFLEQTGLVQLQLRRSMTDEWRRPANIGYGLTYAFPILVAGLLAAPGQVLIIDSPEAHLHPRAQSKMATFIAAMVKAGVQIILESHSDHVLNGVRLAVKDGILIPDQVAVHFFTGGEKGASPVISAYVDTHGGVSDWPDGFFDQAEKDLGSLAGWV